MSAARPAPGVRPSANALPPPKIRVRQQHRRCSSSAASPSGESHVATSYRQAGPAEGPPDYADIDGRGLNKAIMALFRRKMVAKIGSDTNAVGYDAIIDLTRKLNSQYSSPRDTQVATREILQSLFPSWLPKLFKVMFAKPMPALSNKMNALVTSWTCQWLMGPNQVNDVAVDGGHTAKSQGVLVERCRYLEEAGCAAICINSCKVPTQEFFVKDMGLNVTLEPNYDDFSCQFVFGKTPPPEDGDPAFQSPCFLQCPSKQRKLSLENECGGTLARAQVSSSDA